ncbi:hypothetical protein [uncultured Pedobacter sp.]|uniref:hypothetical protein n=1 Tax=uncultured Pedobacter sp. TaxID=246139 RepID=UPI0025D70086|nr:hypothetical protein [uncultured Pedobacter sp.]
MNFPLYIYYELLIRLSEIESGIGDYVSSDANDENCVLRTTNGIITVPINLLRRQSADPNLINLDELIALSKNFKPGYA